MPVGVKTTLKSINKLDVDNTTDDAGGWYINENLDFEYFLRVHSIQYRRILVPT